MRNDSDKLNRCSGGIGTVWVLLLWLGIGQWTTAQPPAGDSAAGQPAASGDTMNSATARQIQELIERLGSQQFDERESASAALLAIGEPALIALTSAERGKDAEISSRAKAIRQRIQRDRFESMATSFKRDPDPTASYGLPGWKTFSRVAGTSRPAKRLFLEMLEHRSIVAMCFEAIESGKVPEGAFDGLPTDPQARLRSVMIKTCSEVVQNLYRGLDPEPGDLIACLIALQVLDDPPLELHEATRMLCNRRALNQLMLMPGAGPSARKMMGAWFSKTPLNYGEEVFAWARLYRIPEGRQMALRVLDSTEDVHTKAEAFMCLTMFGVAEDLPLIDKYVTHEDKLDDFDPPNLPNGLLMERQAPPNQNLPPMRVGPKYRRTLGDMALLAGCKILGLKLESLFPVIRQIDGIILRDSVGFPIDEPAVRASALKVYQEQRAIK